MKTFAMMLSDSMKTEHFDDVVQFIGSDSTGSFGLKAKHSNMVAVLRYGLARFSTIDGQWRYLAIPGGILRFADNVLSLATTRYFLGDERSRIVAQLSAEMELDSSALHESDITLAHIERELIQRLASLNK